MLTAGTQQDLFERIDDEDDDDDYKQRREEWNVMYQFDPWHRSIPEQEELCLGQDDDDKVERVLSQRLSQLSAESANERTLPPHDGKRRRTPITPSTTDTHVKKVRFDADPHSEPYRMPAYLSIDHLMSLHIDMPSHLSIEDLQRLAFCLHQLGVLPIEEELWTGYLRCGTSNSHYWPHHVKSLMVTTTTDQDEQCVCEDIVRRRLQEIHSQIVDIQDDKRQTQFAVPSACEQALRELVREQAVVPTRMKVDMALAVLHCDDKNHSLQAQYQAAEPTDYQKQMAKALYETALCLECAKCELAECRQRLLCDRPPPSYDYLQLALPSSTRTRQRYEQLVQETKTRLMAVCLAGIEARIDQYHTRLREQTSQMWQHHRQQLPDRDMPSTLADLIDERAGVMKKRLMLINNFTIDYHIRSAQGRLENIRKGKEKDQHRIGFLSSLVLDPHVDAQHLLNEQQQRLLHRGPTYVPPCQLHLSVSLSSVEDRIRKQYAPLQHTLALLFARYSISIARQENIKNQIKKEFKAVFSRSIPEAILSRARHEKQCIQSIRTTLKKKNNNWILRRTSDHQNTFYLGQRQSFEETCDAYMNQTDDYQLLFTVDEQNRGQVQKKLVRRGQSLNNDIEALHKQKLIMKDALAKLRVNVDKVSLPHLSFLPELSTDNQLVVTPMICAQKSVTSRIARYLHRLLRPLMASAMQRRVFTDEPDFIQRLTQYSQTEQRLQPTTLFAVIQITNPHSSVPHVTLVETLARFLRDHLVTDKLQYTSLITPLPQFIAVNTIAKLTELYLQHNLFYYKGNIYGFNRSGPRSLPFSEDLLDIYLFAWQTAVFRDERLKMELCGRHHHTLFLTWNQSESSLRKFLHSLTEQYPLIEMQTSFGRSVQFFNTHIENRHGCLYTRLAHSSSHAPFRVPFVIGDSKVEHSRWLHAALLRAGQVCSNANDFVEECIHLEMACLFAGYSVDFLEMHLQHFFRSTNADVIGFAMQQSIYDKLRQRLLDSADTQRARLQSCQELEDKERVLHLHYLHDYGPRARFRHRFNQIWTTYLREDYHLSNEKTKIILDTKHVYSLNALLTEQKAPPLLVNFLQT